MTIPSVRDEQRVITSRAGWLDIDLAGVWRYRNLLRLFVKRDFAVMYKQTALGPLWYLIQPVMSALVFSIIFGRVARLPTDGVPPFLFYLASMVCWGYFSSCLTATAGTFNVNQGLFGKVYFPRLVVPLATVIANLFSFLVQLTMFLGFLAWFMWTGAGVRPTVYLLLLPLLLLEMAAIALGVGLIVTALTTRYRDLAMLLGFGVSLWMYATPIVYPFSLVPDAYKPLMLLNPMTGVVEMFRLGVMGAGSFTPGQYAISLLLSGAILACGVIVFSRFEKSFIDTI
jgi:lipopolysaccharide transport system permease protein